MYFLRRRIISKFAAVMLNRWHLQLKRGGCDKVSSHRFCPIGQHDQCGSRRRIIKFDLVIIQSLAGTLLKIPT